MAVRLLHLSDIHFGGENTAALAATADFIRASVFDLLVITGDLTQYGALSEFRAAAAWLAQVPGPQLATPGNHDTPWFGLVDRLTRPFERYARAIGFPDEARFAAPGLQVRALNTARGWQVRLNWSKGEVSSRQALAACQELQSAPPGDLRILICHHPLLEALGEPITSEVRGGSSAAERLALCGVDVVLTGHLHIPFFQVLPFGDRRTYAVGAGTLSVRERGAPAGFNIVDFEGEQMTVSSMGWRGDRLELDRSWTATLRPRALAG